MRRAGAGRLPDGARVTWTVADGSKGRRWREVVSDGAGIRHSLLLETAPDRRFAHLELATSAGLLTLHPEGDGSLHGNVVDAAGVRHVVGLAWEADGLVVLDGSAVTSAASAWLLDGPGRDVSGTLAVLRITTTLELEVGSWRVAGRSRFAADADGLPVLDDGASWPLELPG